MSRGVTLSSNVANTLPSLFSAVMVVGPFSIAMT